MELMLKLDKLITPAAIARRLQRDADRPTHPSTIIRWILSGVIGPSGERVKLAATRIGDRWYIDPADLEAFVSRLNPPETSELPTPRSPVQRTRATGRAAGRLDRMGAVAR